MCRSQHLILSISEAEADVAQTWWTESGNIGNVGNVEELKKLVRETEVPEVETWQPQLKYQTWEESLGMSSFGCGRCSRREAEEEGRRRGEAVGG